LKKKLAVAVAAVISLTSVVFASDDPIVARKALMDANHAAYDSSKAMMDGEISYNPVVAKAAIMAPSASAHSLGSFFPEGSDTGETSASPKIWKDRDGFNQKLQEFQLAVASAVEISGGSGPVDASAFTSAVGPVFKACRSCHEVYRQH
jgi:cytochrome c556